MPVSKFFVLVVCLAASPLVTHTAKAQSTDSSSHPAQKQASQSDSKSASGKQKAQPAGAAGDDQGNAVQEYHAAPIQPYHAQSIQPYRAPSIQPYHSSIQPYHAQPIQPTGSKAAAKLREQNEQTSATDESAAPAQAAVGRGFFFRAFGLAVPGVAYTVDNYATNTRTITTSTGALTTSAVRIHADHTYDWNSQWDGRLIHGRWVEKEGGILLLHGQEGKDWLLRAKDRPSGAAVVTLWDQQSIWYEGTPLH